MIDEAERWLKENDPEYKNYRNRRNAEYPFHTSWQTFARNAKEIPESNLAGKHTRRVSLGDGNYKVDRSEKPMAVLQYLK